MNWGLGKNEKTNNGVTNAAGGKAFDVFALLAGGLMAQRLSNPDSGFPTEDDCGGADMYDIMSVIAYLFF